LFPKNFVPLTSTIVEERIQLRVPKERITHTRNTIEVQKYIETQKRMVEAESNLVPTIKIN